MAVLVTGGAGFIGSHIVDALLTDGEDVAVVDNLSTGRRTNVNPAARFYEADVRSSDHLAAVFEQERPRVVFHEAAQMSVKASTDDPILDATVNVIGLLNVLNACVRFGVSKVIFASSGAAFGDPHYLPMDEQHPLEPRSPYGITKMVSEHYLAYYAREYGLRFTALRYGNVYGPRQDPHGEAGVVAIFANRLLSGLRPTIFWDGEQTRDYVFVGDVVQANLLAREAGDDTSFCIAMGIATSVNTIYEMMCSLLGVQLDPIRAERRPGEARHARFDCSKAERLLGWRPAVSLEQGLLATVSFFRDSMLQVA